MRARARMCVCVCVCVRARARVSVRDRDQGGCMHVCVAGVGGLGREAVIWYMGVGVKVVRIVVALASI